MKRHRTPMKLFDEQRFKRLDIDKNCRASKFVRGWIGEANLASNLQVVGKGNVLL